MKKIDNNIKTLFDAIGDGILLVDRDYKVVFANQTMLGLFGKKEEEIIGKECYGFFYQFSIPCHSKNSTVICPHYEVFKTGKKIVTTHHNNILPDGTEKIFDVTASPLKNEKGEIIQVVEVFRDVTDRKQAEETLKESEKKYRQLVDTSMAGIYKTNLKGDVIYVNKAIWELLEFDSPEDMKKDNILTRYKNPKDRENLIERLMKTGYVSNFGVDILTKSGKTLNVILSASLERDIILSMMIDVTEQRHAEKAVKDSGIFLSSILEGIQDGMVVLDRDFRVLYANKTYSEQIGTSLDVKGRHCYSILYSREEPCFLSGLECSVKKVFETGLVSREIHKKFDKHMEMIVYPLKDSSGNVLAVVEIRRDVTRHVQLDKELKNRIRELEEFYDMAVGREMRMRELKKEMGELRKELKKSST